MIEYAQGGLIVDDPTYADMARILELMVLRTYKEMWISNPGRDAIPLFEISVGCHVCFLGDVPLLEDECLIMDPSHVARMLCGERLRYRHAPTQPVQP